MAILIVNLLILPLLSLNLICCIFCLVLSSFPIPFASGERVVFPIQSKCLLKVIPST